MARLGSHAVHTELLIDSTPNIVVQWYPYPSRAQLIERLRNLTTGGAQSVPVPCESHAPQGVRLPLGLRNELRLERRALRRRQKATPRQLRQAGQARA